MKKYEVISGFTAFNPETETQKTFEVGDTISAKLKTGADASGLISAGGYTIPPEYVTEISNPVWMLSGIGVAFLVVAFVLVKLFRK